MYPIFTFYNHLKMRILLIFYDSQSPCLYDRDSFTHLIKFYQEYGGNLMNKLCLKVFTVCLRKQGKRPENHKAERQFYFTKYDSWDPCTGWEEFGFPPRLSRGGDG